MGCRREPDLERAAGLLEEGIRPPPEIQATIDHARNCARCGEVLAAFREARALVRQMRDRPKIVLPLQPRGRVRKGPALRPGRGEAGESDAEVGFEMAAAMAAPEEHRRPAMVLECPDERFLVRIVPDEAGPGASAILVTLLPDWSSMAAAIEPRLQVGAAEYPFGPDAVARLPETPSGAMSLVLAETAGPIPGA